MFWLLSWAPMGGVLLGLLEVGWVCKRGLSCWSDCTEVKLLEWFGHGICVPTDGMLGLLEQL